MWFRLKNLDAYLYLYLKLDTTKIFQLLITQMRSAGLGNSDNVSQLYNVSSLNQCRELTDFTIIYSMFSFSLNLNQLLSSTQYTRMWLHKYYLEKNKISFYIRVQKLTSSHLYSKQHCYHSCCIVSGSWMNYIIKNLCNF